MFFFFFYVNVTECMICKAMYVELGELIAPRGSVD